MLSKRQGPWVSLTLGVTEELRMESGRHRLGTASNLEGGSVGEGEPQLVPPSRDDCP